MIFFKHYTLFLLLLSGFFGLGELIVHLLGLAYSRSSWYTRIFVSLLTGLSFFVVLFSLVKTAGQTINLLFIFISIALVFELRKIPRLYTDREVVEAKKGFPWLILGLGSLVIYALVMYAVYKGGDFPYVFQHYDYIFNSNISHCIALTGEENEFHILNQYQADYQGNKPYHYYELWLNAGIVMLTGELNMLSLFVYTFPIFYFLSFLGFLALLEYYRVAPGISALIAMSGLYLGGVFLGVYNQIEILKSASTFQISLMSNALPKLSYYYVFFLAFLLFYIRQWTIPAFLMLFALFVATPVALPAVLGGCGIWVTGSWFLKYYDTKTTIRLLGYLGSTFILFVVFYLLLDNTELKREGTDLMGLVQGLLYNLLDTNYLKTRINIIGGTTVHVALLYAPFLVVFALAWYKHLEVLSKVKDTLLPLLLFTICLYLASLFSWVFLFDLLNAVQLFYNPFFPLFNCIILLMIALLFSRLKRTFQLLFLLCLLLSSGFNIAQNMALIEKKRARQSYSNAYLMEIKEFVAGKTLSRGVSIKSKQEYITVFDAYTTINALGDYLNYLKNGWIPISISDFELEMNHPDPMEAKRRRNAYEIGIFYRFVQAQKQKKEFKSVAQSQLDFIQKHKIQYAIVSGKAKIPPLLQVLVSRQIVDKQSGERFLLFDLD